MRATPHSRSAEPLGIEHAMKLILENLDWIFSGIGIALFSGIILLIRGNVERRRKEKAIGVIRDTPRAIVRAINRVPPLQQKVSAEFYVGQKVDWKTRLYQVNVSKDGTATLMLLDRGSYPWVFCNVNVSDYPFLKTAKKRTAIWVNGEISDVEGNTISVNPVTIRFQRAFHT